MLNKRMPEYSSAVENIMSVLTQNYYYIFLAVGLLSFSTLTFFTLATTTDYSISIFILMNGEGYAIISFLTNIAISFLLGVYASMVAYRFNMTKKASGRTDAAGIAGAFAAAIAAGCPTCGAFVLGTFGAPLGLMLLPFEGIELKALSIVFLIIAVFFISKNACCKNANIK